MRAIDHLMQVWGEPYYVCLLSAAERHGAAHQRPQATLSWRKQSPHDDHHQTYGRDEGNEARMAAEPGIGFQKVKATIGGTVYVMAQALTYFHALKK